MFKEIGSEFWNAEPEAKNKVYLLSGRTSLEYIICDILLEHNIESVLLPSYCCHTMIEPFIAHGIKIRFYDVFFDDSNGLMVEVPNILEHEVFYYMTYFGFSKISGFSLNRIRKDAEIIIEDKTHSWLTDKTLDGTDYSYVSYRKWTGLSGISLAEKHCGFFLRFPEKTHTEYQKKRKQAFSLKQTYIEDGTGDKEEFLSIFDEAETLLSRDYVGYKAEPETKIELLSFDKEKTIEKRRKNAKFIIDGIKNVNSIKLMFPELMEADVPLFVPILIEDGRRELKNYLIDNCIYCPVHWPLSKYHEGISERGYKLYNKELSIICDQRYDESDMERIVKTIKKFYEG